MTHNTDRLKVFEGRLALDLTSSDLQEIIRAREAVKQDNKKAAKRAARVAAGLCPHDNTWYDHKWLMCYDCGGCVDDDKD